MFPQLKPDTETARRLWSQVSGGNGVRKAAEIMMFYFYFLLSFRFVPDQLTASDAEVPIIPHIWPYLSYDHSSTHHTDHMIPTESTEEDHESSRTPLLLNPARCSDLIWTSAGFLLNFTTRYISPSQQRSTLIQNKHLKTHTHGSKNEKKKLNLRKKPLKTSHVVRCEVFDLKLLLNLKIRHKYSCDAGQ